MNKKKILIILLFIIMLISVSLIIIFSLNKYYIDISLNTDSNKITLEYGESIEIPEAEAVYKGTLIHKSGQKIKVQTDSSDLDTDKIGEYEIIYEAQYRGVSRIRKLKVQVVDNQAPYIELISLPEHYTSPNASYQEEGFKAIDNYDGDISDKVVAQEKDGKVFYSVTDSSGHTATAERVINYKDVIKPIIILNGSPEISLEIGSNYIEEGCTATDDCDGDISSKVITEGVVDTSTKGVYEIIYSVEDSYNNKAIAKRKVYVYSKQSLSETIYRTGKIVYLTFDDGPGEYTSKLLDILDKYQVKVTFFVTNQYPAYQSLISDEYQKGHTIALHTYSHNYNYVYSSENAYYEDLSRMESICEKLTGVKPKIVRFPGGSSNEVSKKACIGIMSSLVKSIEIMGYKYCDWNVSSGDAGGTINSNTVAENVINGIRNKDVSVVLQHDIKGFSVDAVEKIISWGLANGYTFLPMDESTPMVHHKVNN